MAKDIDRKMEKIIDILTSIVLPAAATSLGVYVVWRWQKRNPSHPDNISLMQSLINEIQEERLEIKKERDKMREINKEQSLVIQEQKKEVTAYRGEREILITEVSNLQMRVADLENGHEKERDGWRVEKTSLMATINGLRDELEKMGQVLKERIDGVEHQTQEAISDTGRLKRELRKTGQLPELPEK